MQHKTEAQFAYAKKHYKNANKVPAHEVWPDMYLKYEGEVYVVRMYDEWDQEVILKCKSRVHEFKVLVFGRYKEVQQVYYDDFHEERKSTRQQDQDEWNMWDFF